MSNGEKVIFHESFFTFFDYTMVMKKRTKPQHVKSTNKFYGGFLNDMKMKGKFA